MKKTILAAAIAAFAMTGCATSGMNKMLSQLKNDPASFHVRVSSVYGTIELTRANPLTNSAAYTVSPDGTITVGGGGPAKPGR